MDNYQGKEKKFVVFFSAVTPQSGIGFQGVSERLCITLTRHEEALLIIGDPQIEDSARQVTIPSSVTIEAKDFINTWK